METPLLATPHSYRWYEVWQKIYLHPSMESFLEILADPTAKASRAYLWIAVVAVISGLVEGIAAASTTRALGLLCGVLLGPVFGIFGLWLGAAIIHIIAGLFGGKGLLDQLVYATGAISAPATLISVILTLIGYMFGIVPGRGSGSAVTLLSLCLVPISLVLAIEIIVLQINAIRAVEKLSTGKALITLLFPLILVIILSGACVALALIPAYSGRTF